MRRLIKGIQPWRVVAAVLSGWLMLLYTPYSLVLDHIYDTRLVWPLLFPMLIAIAWEPVYSYIAGFGGLIFLAPFLEMPERGLGNALIGALYLLMLILCGHFCNRPGKRLNYYLIHVAFSAFYYTIMVTLYRWILQYNPGGTAFLRFTSPIITRVQAITFVCGYMALISFIKVLISLPAVCTLLRIPKPLYSKQNSKLFFISLLVVIGFFLVDGMFEAFYFDNRGLHTSILSNTSSKVIKFPIVFTAACIICDAIISSTMKNIEAHDKLSKSEKRYRMIFENTADAYMEIDEEGTILRVNPAIRTALGFTPASLLGLHISHLFSDKQAIQALLDTLFHDNQVNNIEIPGQLYNNGSCSLLVSGNVMYLGEQRLAVLTARNITDYKKAEEKRWELAALLNAIFESNRDSIWTVDCQSFSLISFNQAFAQYVRKHQGRDIQSGSTMADAFSPEDSALFSDYFQRVLREGDFSVEYRTPQGKGTMIWDVHFYPIKLRDKISSIAVFTKNVTAQKRAEQKIVELNEGLEQMVQERTRELQKAYSDLESFSFTVTHEFKTPIREIDTYLEIIQEDNYETLNPQSQQDILSARKVCQQTLDMIDKMMLYTKAGFMVLNIEKIDIQRLVRSCFNEIQQAKESGEMELTLYALPAVFADAFLLRIAVMNIMSNSVKFSHRDKAVSIVVGYMRNEVQTTYYFRDNGVGFQSSSTNDLFTLFNRAHNNNEYEGSGIGLALVQRIMNRLGGHAAIHSEPDRGCVVYLTFRNDFQQLE